MVNETKRSCGKCGVGLSSDANFCAKCGTAVGETAPKPSLTAAQSAEHQAVLDAEVSRYQAQGWTVMSKEETRARISKGGDARHLAIGLDGQLSDELAQDSLPAKSSGGHAVRNLLLGIAAVVALLAIIGVVSSIASSTKTFTLNGTLSAPQCDGGYNLSNAPVTVRNENNKLIASTSADATADSTSQCVVRFSVAVPAAKYYQIKVGTHDGPAYSFAELQALNFSLDLSLK